jgi:5-hydroxyisourate hydrolase-like protein (transthyretin family)
MCKTSDDQVGAWDQAHKILTAGVYSTATGVLAYYQDKTCTLHGRAFLPILKVHAVVNAQPYSICSTYLSSLEVQAKLLLELIGFPAAGAVDWSVFG